MVTNLALNRKFQQDKHGKLTRREKPIEIPMQDFKLECGRGRTYIIKVGPNQLVNVRKTCLKLLKQDHEKNNEPVKNKFVSKGYKGQDPYYNQRKNS